VSLRSAADARPLSRVTVISADPAFLQVATEMLESAGYSVTCLMAAPDVAARIVRTRPDLLCTDVDDEKPDARGQLAKWVSEYPELARLPTLFLTSTGATSSPGLGAEGLTGIEAAGQP